MSRISTGARVTNSCRRIELSYLLKEGFLKKGKITSGTLSWTDDSWLSIKCLYTEDKQYIRLIYTIRDSFSGVKRQDMDYKVQVTTVPSNLGKGEVPYLVCPASGHRCRILYQAYGSNIYKCRKAYKKRIYYPTQISSKYGRYNDRYWQLDRMIKKMEEETRDQTLYNGKPTKRYKRLQRLKEERERMEFLRWTPLAVPKSIRQYLYKDWPNS